MKKILAAVLAALMLTCSFAGCSDDSDVEIVENDDGVKIVDGVVHGEIILELYPDKAPITVDNFVGLVKKGFYDGLTFHRIYAGFMIQGGDPAGNGTGGSDKEIKGEFSANGVENDISHLRGVISMARGSHSMDSASSQFFICHKDSKFLDGQYAAFGKVTEGMEVVDALAAVETVYGASGEKTTPVITQYIKNIKVLEEGSTVKVKLTVGNKDLEDLK